MRGQRAGGAPPSPGDAPREPAGRALPARALTLVTRPRRYQSLALDAYARARQGGRDRSYLVLPPGAGKTLVGLEVVRRERRRALVLVPNTAVQAQWVAQWGQHVRTEDGSTPQAAGTDRSFAGGLTVLTYQALAVLGRAADDDDADTDVERAQRRSAARRSRTTVLRTGTPAELLDLLHPNARAAVDQAAGRGPWTLVLDEAHHLLELGAGSSVRSPRRSGRTR